MASMSDFRRVADDVRNWGRWGDADELGTLNFITTDKVAEAASLVKHGKVFPLGVDFGSSGPQGAFHFRQNPLHVMTIDGGDASTLLEYGPKWLQNPAAGQLSRLFRGQPDAVQRRHDHHAVASRHPVGCALARLLRGLPLQRLPGELRHQPRCASLRHRQGRRQGHHFTRGTARHRPPARCRHLLRDWATRSLRTNSTAAVQAQGVTIRRGDIVLVRTGWWARFLETGDGGEPGAGLDWTCASWLHDHEAAAGTACASAGRRPRRRTLGSRPSGCRRRRPNAEDGQKGAMSLAQYLIDLVKTKMEIPRGEGTEDAAVGPGRAGECPRSTARCPAARLPSR